MNVLDSGRGRRPYATTVTQRGRVKRINDYSRDPWDRFLGRLANAAGVLCFAVLVVWVLRLALV